MLKQNARVILVSNNFVKLPVTCLRKDDDERFLLSVHDESCIKTYVSRRNNIYYITYSAIDICDLAFGTLKRLRFVEKKNKPDVFHTVCRPLYVKNREDKGYTG